MKNILGLDLGTGSIGWAYVREAENSSEQSSIVKMGVRIVPLTVDEQNNFEQGKSITTNADRNLKKGARINLQRYKLRRENLIACLKSNGLLSDETSLYDNDNTQTFHIYRMRAKAASEQVPLEDFARILLMINKKRGYKSNRKAKGTDEGQLIDGMEIAKKLYETNQTPGQYVYNLLEQGLKYVPDFYRSDLQAEFDKVWNAQQSYYPDFLTGALKKEIDGKTNRVTAAIIKAQTGVYTADNKGKDKRLQGYKWRSEAVERQLSKEEVAYVLCDLNGAINNSSSYLGSISDRSKELYFKNQTVGQYLMSRLDQDPHFSLKNKVFYRLDYLNEFEQLWETQAKYYPVLTPELKQEIRDIIIFYQRPLKSKKGLIDICELEGRKIKVVQDGKERVKVVGPRVCPKSSPLFQEFRTWQILNNLQLMDKATGEKRFLDLEEKQLLNSELQLKEKLSRAEALKLLFAKPKALDLNYETLEGDRTQSRLFAAYQQIIAMSGHGEYDFKKMEAAKVMSLVEEIFGGLGYNTAILHFDATLPGQELEKQPFYHLWHLLYSYEGDKSNTGVDGLIAKISALTGMEKEYATVIANITFEDDYGNLSAKALRKILPYMKEGNDYSTACAYAGYNHSKKSLTKEELETRELKDHLDLLPKNSLRNPVVEKILNQMVNVVNAVVDQYGKPDEVRIELARELKKNAKQRSEMSQAINKATLAHEEYRKILQKEFNIPHVSRNAILRYKLYLELKDNGFKTLYSGTYIPREKLFSKEFDIEHILPQAKLFDDSFSNKTLEARSINIDKGKETAYDYVKTKYGEEGLADYKLRVDKLLKEGAISKTKHDKLLMANDKIPQDFIQRDLRDSQYIARKAKDMLEELVRRVVSTTGAITDRLREDWQLVDVMQELNLPKYRMMGNVEQWKDKDGRTITHIKDWTKRNDHRHHAMDALTIAFTKYSYIQYLNNLNARSDHSSSIYHIEKKELERDQKGKLRFIPPMPLDVFRAEAKKHLQRILVSIKGKNKVMTRNVNRTKCKEGFHSKVQLTPRGQLHNETIYGSIQRYETKYEKVGANFTAEVIQTVANKKYREALLQRLAANDNNAKKAFTGKNSLEKNPLYVDEHHLIQVPAKVKTVRLETTYTIRKEISPDLKLDKVIDVKVRTILQQRLDEYGGNAKQAFANLDENPIYLNKEKGITIKRVTITGVANAVPLRAQKDHHGDYILDEKGNRKPVDYVNTGNNHHVAIFLDEAENLQEHVVSFYEATARASMNLPVIDTEYQKENGWKFLFTMKQNDYFVFPNAEKGFNPSDIELANPDNYSLISENLYRVQKFSTKDYVFRHHLETTVEDKNETKNILWKRCGLAGLTGIVKVRINHLGEIVHVGE